MTRAGGCLCGAVRYAEKGADWERPPDGVPAYPRGYPTDSAPVAWH